jgi:hypothetical protein
MDRAYRDSRINRIFEGTNEINRLLTMDMLLKRAMKGELDLMGPAMAVQKDLMAIPDFNTETPEGLFGKEKAILANVKKLILMTAGYAAQKFMQKLVHEQEILMNISDMVIDLYVAESTLLRVEKMANSGKEVAVQTDIVKTYLNDALDRVGIHAKTAIVSMSEGDEQRMLLMGVKRFTKADSFNTKEARRRIAASLIEANEYAL